jgi:hypothetical protein
MFAPPHPHAKSRVALAVAREIAAERWQFLAVVAGVAAAAVIALRLVL